MALSEEVFNELPEEVKSDYELHDGVYVTVDSLKVGGLKESLNNLDSKMKTEHQKQEEAIRIAAETARNEAIEEAAKKGNWEEQERLLREKFDDELSRKLEEERGNVAKEFTIKQEQEALKNDIKLLATELAIDDDAKNTLELVLSQRAKLDESGKRNYFGEDGSALSIADFKSFANEVGNSKSVARLIKGKTPTKGGGFANGGSGDGGAVNKNTKAQKAKEAGDLTGFLNASFNNK